MYSYEDRLRAVRLYIKLGKRVRLTIRQLYTFTQLLAGEKVPELVILCTGRPPERSAPPR